jgi:hypothetical protein
MIGSSLAKPTGSCPKLGLEEKRRGLCCLSESKNGVELQGTTGASWSYLEQWVSGDDAQESLQAFSPTFDDLV